MFSHINLPLFHPTRGKATSEHSMRETSITAHRVLPSSSSLGSVCANASSVYSAPAALSCVNMDMPWKVVAHVKSGIPFKTIVRRSDICDIDLSFKHTVSHISEYTPQIVLNILLYLFK